MARQNPLAQVAEPVVSNDEQVIDNETPFVNGVDVDQEGNEVDEVLTTKDIVAKYKKLGAKTVKAVASSIRTYTNDQGFVSIVFGLRKSLPTTSGNVTEAYFAGWKEVRSILVQQGYEAFNLLLDFDKKEDPVAEAKRIERLNLCMTYLLPNCTINLLSREINAGEETLSNPFSTRKDEGAYFVPSQDAVRYNCFEIVLSADAKAMLDTAKAKLTSKMVDLML